MKIEINKKYKTRDGKTVQILKSSHGEFHGASTEVNGTSDDMKYWSWDLAGNYKTGASHPLDLVEEVCEFKVGKTYLTVGGDKVLITYILDTPTWPWRIEGKINGEYNYKYKWLLNGSFSLYKKTPNDLIYPPKEFVENVENTPKKLVIEAGKFYKTRDGHKVTIYKTGAKGSHYPIHGCISHENVESCRSWKADGTFYTNRIESMNDIVSEWIEPEVLPIIEWTQLPAWANFVAMDKNNTWYYYTEKPSLESDCYCNRFMGRIPDSYSPKYNGDWKKSLQSRF